MFTERIRQRGPVLDMPLTQELYAPLLQRQTRDARILGVDLGYGRDPRHKLDLYAPASPPSRPQPVVACFHGGGFVRGDKADRENLAHRLCREGFLVAVPNYRLGPAHHWPAGAEDVASVLAWLHQHVAEYGGDPQRIFLVGESAGAAHIAAATLIKRFHPSAGLAIAGAALVSGVYNVRLEYLARRQLDIATPDPRNEAYFGTDAARYPGMSTVDLIDAPPFPLLITWAEQDMPQMQIQAGELFARLVTRHGFAPEIAVIPGHNHLTQIYSVNTGDDSLVTPLLNFLRR